MAKKRSTLFYEQYGESEQLNKRINAEKAEKEFAERMNQINLRHQMQADYERKQALEEASRRDALNMIRSGAAYVKPVTGENVKQAYSDMNVSLNPLNVNYRQNSAMRQLSDTYQNYQTSDRVSAAKKAADEAARNLSNVANVYGRMNNQAMKNFASNARNASSFYRNASSDMDSIGNLYANFKTKEDYDKEMEFRRQNANKSDSEYEKAYYENILNEIPGVSAEDLRSIYKKHPWITLNATAQYEFGKNAYETREVENNGKKFLQSEYGISEEDAEKIVNNWNRYKTALSQIEAIEQKQRAQERFDKLENQYNSMSLSDKEKLNLVSLGVAMGGNLMSVRAYKTLEKNGYNVGDLLDYLKIRDARENEQKMLDNVQNSSNLGLAGKNLLAAGATVGQILEVPEQILYSLEGKPYDTSLATLTNYKNAVREETKNRIPNNGFVQSAYDIGSSMADSAVSMGTGALLGAPGVSLAMMGASAASNAYIDAVERGLPENQALITAMANGGFEMLFEKVSLDNLIRISKPAAKRGLKKATLEILRQAGIEGSEEVFTSVADELADRIVNQELSVYNTKVMEYMRQGDSESEAKKKAELEFVQQLGMDFIGGAVSGGLFATAGIAISSYNYRQLAKGMNEESTETIHEAALQAPEDTVAYRIASEKEASELTVSDKEEMLKSLNETRNDEINSVVENIMKENLEDSEKANEAAGIVTEALQNGETSEEIQKKLEKKFAGEEELINTVQEVTKDLVGGTYDGQFVVSNALSQVQSQVQNRKSRERTVREAVRQEATENRNADNESQKRESLEDAVSGIENETLKNLIVRNYSGQSNIDGYVDSVRKAYDAGRISTRSGQSFNAFYSNPNNADILLDSSYATEYTRPLMQEAFFLGVNETEGLQGENLKQYNAEYRKASNVEENLNNPEGELNVTFAALTNLIQSKINMVDSVDTGGKQNSRVLASFDNGIINISKEGGNQYNSAMHEIMEKIKGENSESYNAIVKEVLTYMLDAKGNSYLQERLGAYQKAYKNVEGTEKALEDILDEYVNDFVAGTFSTKKGIKDFARHVANNSKTKAHEALQKIVDLFNRIIEEITSYLKSHSYMNLAARDGLKAERRAAQRIRDMVLNEMEGNETKNTKDAKSSKETESNREQKELSDEDTNYSVSVNGKEYDYLGDILGMAGHAQFMHEISNNNKDKYVKTAENDYMVPIENKLVITDFNKSDPGISAIIVFNTNDYTEIDSITQTIYECMKGYGVYEEAIRIVEDIIGQGDFVQYTNHDFGFHERYDRQRARGKRRSDYYHNQRSERRANYHFGSEETDRQLSVKADSQNRAEQNVINDNPTNDHNIRYSVEVPALSVDTIGFEVWDEMMKEEELKTAQSIIAAGAESLKDIVMDDKKIDKVAKQILKQHSSTYNRDDLVKSLKSVFAYMTDTADANYDVLLQVMKDVAKPILENSSAKNTTYDWVKMKEYLDGVVIALSPKQIREVESNYTSYENYRRSLFGVAKIGKNGIPLDNIWGELADASGGKLNVMESDTNQPQALKELIDSLRPQEYNPYGMDLEHASYDVALEIYRKFFELEDEARNNQKVQDTVRKLVEKQEKYREKSKKKYQESIKKYRDELEAEKQKNINEIIRAINNLDEEKKNELQNDNEVVAAMIEAEKRAYEKRLGSLKAQKNDEIAKIKAKHAESKENQRARQKNSSLRQFITSDINQLNKMLKSPNSDNNIKVGLIKPTIAILEAIDVDTGRSRNLKEKLDQLKDMYDSYKMDERFDVDLDENTMSIVDELRTIFTGRNITEITNEELEKVLEVVKRLKAQIRNANTILKSQKMKDAKEAAAGIVSEIINSDGTNNAVMTKLDNLASLQLSPERWFRKTCGYVDGYFYDLYDQLDRGQQKKLKVEREINNIFEPVLEGRENQKQIEKMTSTKKEDLVDVGLEKLGTGKKALISKEMRMSLLMHTLNKENMRHALFGGFTVPDMKLYGKRDFEEAFARAESYHFPEYIDKVRQAAMEASKFGHTELIDIAIEDCAKDLRNKILNSLSEYEMQFYEVAKEFFHKYTGKQINSVSTLLKGYAIASVKNYFPIKTDRNFTKTEFAGLVRDGSLEGMGFLKSRVKTKNPILLEGITNVITRQTDNVSSYVGFAVPVRNINMLAHLNVKDRNNVYTLDSVLQKKWGSKNKELFKRMVQDVQTKRTSGNEVADAFMSKLRGNYAAATLTANVGVAIKQAASFPTAAAELGWKPLAGAISDIKKGAPFQGIEELERINPILWYRSKGNSSADIEYAKKSEFYKALPEPIRKISVDLIQSVDTATVRTLEYAAKRYVDDNYNNLEKDSIEYWEKVSEVFTKTVERTQPNYTVMQRPELLRTGNTLLKQLVMFKTQPLQNFGILYDATGNLLSKMKYRKSDNTELRKEYEEAKKRFVNAFTSQLVAAAVFSGMTILANIIYHKQWKYDKDENKSQEQEMLEAWMKGIMSTYFGMITFGENVYQMIDEKFFGGTNYGLQVSIVEMFNDFYKSATQLELYGSKYSNAKTDADREKYILMIKKNVENIAQSFGQFTGIPFNNIKNLLDSTYLYIEDVANGRKPGTSELRSPYNVTPQKERVYRALTEGNMDEFNRLRNQMIEASTAEKPEESVNNSIIGMIKTKYQDKEIVDEHVYDYLTKLGYEESEIFSYLQKWEYGENTDYAGLYSNIDKLVESGSSDRKELVSICQELSKYKEKENIKKTITTKYKKMYLEASGNDKINIKNILLTVFRTIGYTDKEANEIINNWK